MQEGPGNGQCTMASAWYVICMVVLHVCGRPYG